MTIKFSNRLLIMLFITSLAACSTGSDPETSTLADAPADTAADMPSDTPAVLTGQFIDSAVAGVRFATETRGGTTDSDGNFQYIEGETVRFYLGDLLLGDASGAATVSVFDLVDGVEPVSGNALSNALNDSATGPSLNTVINLATLLQTMDSDGDPDNGIDISAAVAALFAADSIDFDQPWSSFINDRGFRQALSEAKSSELLENTRQVRKGSRVMSHLYGSLGLDSTRRVVSKQSLDIFADGTVEQVTSYEYDSEGRVIQVENGNDPVSSTITTYTYDDNGNRIREDRRVGNGELTPFATYSYDADGNRTLYEVDSDGDGAADYTETYSYDDFGNLTLIVTDRGVNTSRYTFTYDSDGNQVLAETDSDNDGAPESIVTRTFNAIGKVDREDTDQGGDGTVDVVLTKTYDDDGRLILDAYDDDADGTADRSYPFTYDTNGKPTTIWLDYNFDGMLDEATFTYDENGNLLTSRDTDWNYDGQADLNTSILDEDGYVVRSESDQDLDGTMDVIVTYEYVDINGWSNLLGGF